MSTIQIALILICGYIFVTNSLSDRYKFKRSTGWDAYFYVAVWGFVFTSVAWGVCSILSLFDFFRWAGRSFEFSGKTIGRMFPLNGDSSLDFKDMKLVIWAALSLLLSWVAGAGRKLWLKDEDRHIAVLAKVTSTNALEALLMEASARQFPVIVTLKSRKVYVGIVSCPAFEHGDCEFLELLPLLSGYRDKDTLSVNFTSNYQNHYVKQGIGIVGNRTTLTLDDFRTLLPKREVDNVSFFDINTYKSFQADEQNKPA